MYERPSLRDAAKAIPRLPKPRSDAELRLLTLLCFGRESGLLKFDPRWAKVYQSDTKFGDMFSPEFYEHHNTHSGCIDLYDYAGAFWDHVIAKLHCGGIAGHSHGQFKVYSHRDKQRLLNWEKDRREKRGSPLRTPFVRLARQLRDGKNREIRGIPVLISSRVDGVEAALLAAHTKQREQ